MCKYREKVDFSKGSKKVIFVSGRTTKKTFFKSSKKIFRKKRMTPKLEGWGVEP